MIASGPPGLFCYGFYKHDPLINGYAHPRGTPHRKRGPGIGDLYRIYTITQRDGVDYNLAYIPATFQAPHTAEFDTVYMSRVSGAAADHGPAAAAAVARKPPRAHRHLSQHG